MFSNIKYGWANFDFKGFKGVCSYIQDPVKDICQALIDTFENKSKVVTVEIDEEGTEWFLEITPDLVRMYREENPQEVQTSREDFIKEFVSDVYRDIELWSKWEPENDPESVYDDIESALFKVVFPELREKCQNELKDWKAIQLKGLKGEEIFKCAYELTYKEELLTILEDSDFDLSTYIWLYNKDLPLDYLYNVWLHCDASVIDILVDMILEEKRRELND